MLPPFPLIPEVLQGTQASNCHAILVAPAWPSQPWFPRLLSLLDDHPRRPPLWQTLLRQPRSRAFHPDPSRLSLHVWRLSSRPSSAEAIPRRWQPASPRHTVSPHSLSTTANGASSLSGAGTLDTIHSLPLPVLADFLAFLFTAKGFAPTTIAGYCTIIINTLEKVTGHRLADEHLISSLLNQFESEHPRLGRIYPRLGPGACLMRPSLCPIRASSQGSPLGADLQDGLLDSSRLGQASVEASRLLLLSSTP